MADKNAVENEKKEKVMTKYDLKMQRREEEKKKDKRDKVIGNIVIAVIVIALVALVAYIPINYYLRANEVYVTIGGEDISRAEFDFNYNVVVDNYIAQYESYLGYMGIDRSVDLSQEMYDETLTWEDHFQEMTVDDLKKTKALKKAAEAAGFSYNSASEVAQYKADIKQSASGEGTSASRYIKELYGPYATMGRIGKYYEEALFINAYYQQVSEGKTASEDEIAAYYNENKSNYDSVDYYIQTIEAELPTAPTELADEGAEVTVAEDGTESYQPSDAEIEKAMADAKVKAEEAEKSVKTNGEFRENQKKSAVAYLTMEWLFDDARKAGDTTVIENSYSHSYYVLSYENRYRDETPTASLRVIMTQSKSGQEILDEWAAGAATEESFIEICDKYSEVKASIGEGGLLKNVAKESLSGEIADWLFEEGRKPGDTKAVTSEQGYSYVMYYVGQGDPEWKDSIANTLLNQNMSDYVDDIVSKITVEDKKGKLNYLKVQAAAPAGTEGETGSPEDAAQ